MTRSLGILVVCGACACNALLGIEEAHVDPALEALGNSAPRDGKDAGAFESPQPGSPTGGQASSPEVAEPESSPDSKGGGGSSPIDEAGDDETAAEDDDAPGAGGAPPGEASSEPSAEPVAGPDDDATSAPESDAGGEATNPEPEGVAPSLCDEYCEEVTEQCVGDMEQYRDLRQCLTVCKLLPEGELATDANENTVACRLRYASQARYAAGTEQAAYCRRAGPGGDGRCGTNCEGYCTLMMQVCSPEGANIYRYDSMDACLDACNALPVSDEPYSTTSLLVADGNHVQCRLFHVTSAAMLDTEEHCEHAIGITLCQAPEETLE